MNAIRRVLLALYSLLLLAACGGLLALAWNQDKKLDIQLGEFNIQAFIVSSDGARAIFAVIIAAVALVAFFSLVASVWRSSAPRSRGVLALRQEDGGMVEVPAQTLEAILREALQLLPEVRRAEPRVDVRAGAVESHIDATIQPSVSIAAATKVMVDTVHAVLREQVGVTNVRRPAIRITYDELAARPAGMAPQRAASPAVPPQPPAAVGGQAPPPAPIFPAVRESTGPESPAPERRPDE
ncbi:alkaline shock response membrane anchor protein AmaP [Tepidiforma sp.]|uniref:alkaline shock response membrane anchor protein AmaP n=1 Tax=Tepidiforma sp. TaxID=2682230 RepID=UPI002ADD7272|nr:alkaline shock response membrane anchor protein AmaP [Tepidiforma sp.]